MLKSVTITVFLLMLFSISAFAQERPFDDIFPNISQSVKKEIFSQSGLTRSCKTNNGFTIIGESDLTSALDRNIFTAVLNMKPSHLVEAVTVIPIKSAAVSILDIYNALSRIRGLKGILYNSHTRKQLVPLFEDATRILNSKQTTSIPDPVPALSVPSKETIYIRLKDVNFGNSYYRCEMLPMKYGIFYSLTNYKNMTYLLIPVIKEKKFMVQFYFEPVKEGILIYSIAGADVSDFFSSRIDMISAISKRLDVITAWAMDGIK